MVKGELQVAIPGPAYRVPGCVLGVAACGQYRKVRCEQQVGHRENIPAWVPERLLENAREMFARGEEDLDLTRGPMISRFSFMIDVREWGFSDPRSEMVREKRNSPEVRAIVEADVWHERSEERPEPREETPAAPPTRTAV